MDIATLIGIVGAFGLVITAMSSGGSLGSFVDVGSLMIVLGGTLAVTLVNERMGHVLGAVKVAMNAFLDRKSLGAEEMIQLIVHLAQKARKEGLVSLEGESIDDPFMARGVRLGVDGLSPEVITGTLSSELTALKQRHQRGQAIFKFMAASAPAMGMVGTLVGLVQMLQNLDDPSAIGPGMAVALLTTLYGAMLAFMVCGPIAAKLETRTNEESQRKNLAIAGVESILKGDNTLVIQSKLESFLAPAQREAKEA